MYMGPEMVRFLQQLYYQLGWQAEKLNLLDQSLRQMQSELEQLKQQRPITIEKIEYNFDQLKVETLEGTLNIGITPQSAGALEQMTVNDQTVEDVQFEQETPDSFGQIQQEMRKFLVGEAEQKIAQFENKHHFIFGDELRKAIINDMLKQMDDRIRHYMNVKDGREAIVENMKRDIRSALGAYLNRFQHKEGEGS